MKRHARPVQAILTVLLAALATGATLHAQNVQEMPVGFAPWWQPQVSEPLRDGAGKKTVDVESLIIDALRYSPRVRAISENALIRQTAIVEANAEFDIRAFMESKFVRTSIPTGSTLDAGVNVPRLREEDWFYSAGIRRKNQLGGRFEAAQRIGLRDSNSIFFTPENQGNSRLTLNYTQPLLNGYGKPYNRSLIVLADLDTRVARNRTSRELQDHLSLVTEAYWQLFLQRAALLQKREHLERAAIILRELEGRRDVDSLPSQIARARAAVATRSTELIRAETTIRNAEARLRALINPPDLQSQLDLEIVPLQPPRLEQIEIEMQDALIAAVQNRPEIDEAMAEIQAASVRLDMAKNELLPVLDMVLETYVTGLQGGFDIGQAFADQFQRGEPSYTAGLVFEVPLGNRAARARHDRRRLELRQLSSQFQTTVDMLKAEVEVAVREVDTAHREIQSQYHAMVAANDDVGYLQRRWELLPGEDRAASFLLADLLDAQDRLAAEEFGFSRAQRDYTLSLAQFYKATGTLLRQEQISVQQIDVHGLPQVLYDKPLSPTSP